MSLCIPLLKPNKIKTLIESYRPISLISCLSKTLEKIVAKRLNWFLRKNKLISHKQVAFKPSKGTLDVILYIDHLTSASLSTGNHLSVVSIDLEKAFDKIGIHAILHQLLEWKVGPKILNYVKSFMLNRKFRVKVNGFLSDARPLHNGIPQGSPLSVVLFQIAMEKLNKIIEENRFFSHCIYADDIYLIAKIKDPNVFCNEFDTLFEQILKMNEFSGCKISQDKTKILHICNKKSCFPPDVFINNCKIQYVQNLNILGVVFSKNLKWSSHIDYLKKSLTHRLSLVKCIASHNSNSHINTIINIIKSIIVSKIDYGLPLYGHTSKANLQKIESIYHSAVRLALGAFKCTPIINILTEAGLSSIVQTS